MCDACNNLSSIPDHTRRSFLQMLGAAGLAVAVPQTLHAAAEVAVPKPQNVLTPEQALARLKEGNARYVSHEMEKHDFAMDREALTHGQNPFAGLLSCSDSRVASEYAFDTGRGDLFVVRLAGNFAPTEAIASFEYAVQFLGTPLLVVLGHDQCGAVAAAIQAVKQDAELPGHLPELIESIRPAVKQAMTQSGDLLANAIRENVLLNIEKIKRATPILKKAILDKKLLVVGGIYKLDTGAIEWLE